MTGDIEDATTNFGEDFAILPDHANPEPASHMARNDQLGQPLDIRQPGLRFSLRTLSIAVAIVACLLALPSTWLLLVLAFACPCLAQVIARWQLTHHYLTLSAWCFGIVATSINVAYAAACIYPMFGVLLLFFSALFATVPTVLCFGVSWATMATQDSGFARRSPRRAWLLVIVVAVMPLTTLGTFWPLHLFFLATKPKMEALADRTAAGTPIASPTWVGPFRLVGSRVIAGGDVSLMIDSHPGGESGFVRVGASALNGGASDDALNLDIRLAGRWRYQESD